MAESKLSKLTTELENFDINSAKKDMGNFYKMLNSAPKFPKEQLELLKNMNPADRERYLQQPAVYSMLTNYVNSMAKITSEAERLQGKFENILGSQSVVNEAIAESQKEQIKQINVSNKKF